MKRKFTLLFLIISVLSFEGIFMHQALAQHGWNGNADTGWYVASEDSFELTTAEQLAGLASLVNEGNIFQGKTIILKNDIILNNINNAEAWLADPSGNEWSAIGTSTAPFKGTFDGNKHTISGLYIKTVKNDNGLFGVIEDAVIKNIGLVNFYMNAGQYNGGIAGYSENSTFENVYNKGKIIVDRQAYIGGLVGKSMNSNFECVSSHMVISFTKNVNGIGGLIGYCENTDIRNAYTIGEISAPVIGFGSNIGGIVGYQESSKIYYTYTVCEISGRKSAVGGISGFLTGINNVEHDYYNTDKFDGDEFGSNKGDGFFDVEGKNSTELKKSETFERWDFENTWAISANKNEGYPYLLMEEAKNPSVVYPDTLYVKENGDDTKDGSNWNKAITLKKALEVINDKDYDPSVNYQIHIAKGDYYTEGEAFQIKK